MVQSSSSAANWFAASQEIPRISRNPKVHYRTHKRPPPVSILGQPNPVHMPTSHLLEIHPNIIHPSTPRSPHWSPSLRFPHQDPIHSPLLTHTRHMPSPSNKRLIVASCWFFSLHTFSYYSVLRFNTYLFSENHCKKKHVISVTFAVRTDFVLRLNENKPSSSSIFRAKRSKYLRLVQTGAPLACIETQIKLVTLNQQLECLSSYSRNFWRRGSCHFMTVVQSVMLQLSQFNTQTCISVADCWCMSFHPSCSFNNRPRANYVSLFLPSVIIRHVTK